MGINIGLDIGAISLKLAALWKPGDRPALVSLCAAHPEFRLTAFQDRPLMLSDYRRIAGSPIQSTYDLLRTIYDVVPEDRVEGIRVTGSGSRTSAKVLGLFFENEFKAIARMIRALYPHIRTVFEICGVSSAPSNNSPANSASFRNIAEPRSTARQKIAAPRAATATGTASRCHIEDV